MQRYLTAGLIMLMAYFTQIRGATITVGSSGADHTTLAAAVSVAQAGDVVEVAAGTYGEKITTVRSGTSGNIITIKAVPSRSATITGVAVNHDYIRIEGFESSGGMVIKASNIQIIDNFVNSAQATAFNIDGRAPFIYHHIDIKDNRVYKCAYGAVIGANDVLFENNEIERIFKYSSSGDADYTRVFGERNIIRGNHFHGTLESEIGNAHLDIVQIFTNNGEYTRDLLIENNIFEDAHQGIMSSNVRGTNTGYITVRNNIYNNMWAWGILGWDVTDYKIYNNLFANMVSWGCKFTGASHNNEVYNNIFFFCREKSYFTENGATLTGDYNLTYVSMNPPVTGEHNQLVKNPAFVDFRTYDFHLTDASMCIDNGMDVDFDYDLEGNPRKVGAAVDIGPYEYQGTGMSPFDIVAALNNNDQDLPNPVRLNAVRSISLARGIRWFTAAGEADGTGAVTEGVYFIKRPGSSALSKILVVK